MSKNKSNPLIFLCIAALALIIIYPQQALTSAQGAASLWLNIVLPSLFPYMVGTSILYYTGSSTGIISLLNKLIPSSGAAFYSIIFGWLSGTPTGAKVLSELKSAKLVSPRQRQTLLTAVSCAGPVFMLGSVAGGLLGDTRYGIYIMLPNYLGAVIAALTVYLTSKRSGGTLPGTPLFDSLPFSEALEKSVVAGMANMLKVAGYIMLYSVLAELLAQVGLITLLSAALRPVFSILFIEPELAPSFLTGIMEMTVGCQAVSMTDAALTSKIALCTAITAWNGLSVINQSLSFNKGINIKVYIASKAVHAAGAYCLSRVMMLLFPIAETAASIQELRSGTFPVFGLTLLTVAMAFTVTALLAAAGWLRNKSQRNV